MNTHRAESMILTPEQIAFFWEHGYLTGIPVLTPVQTGRLRHHFERIEATERNQRPHAWRDPHCTPWDDPAHPFATLFRTLSTHPVVLSAVSSLLGPNILVRNADVFVKDGYEGEEIDWHIDTAASWPGCRNMVNAWLSLTPSTETNGCMWFLPGVHAGELTDGPTDRHHLTLSSQAIAHLDTSRQVANVMPAGHLSFHSFRTPHRSGQNQGGERRIGYVTRFMAANVPRDIAECGQGFLAAGTNLPGHFGLRDDFPVGWFNRQ